MRSLEETRLSMEEAEALRLKDLEGLDQESAAARMNVSRPTCFSRGKISPVKKPATRAARTPPFPYRLSLELGETGPDFPQTSSLNEQQWR